MTNEQRQSLVNQYKILALLDKDNRSEHELNAQILEDGHAHLYDQVFSNLAANSSEKVGEETHQILTMFRVIDSNLKQFSPEELDQLGKHALSFDGFDANEREGHYSFARFIMNKMKLYSEHNPADINSHSMASLPRYRGMLAVYNGFKNKSSLTFEQLQQLANAESVW